MTGSMCSAAGLCSDPLPDAGPIAGQRAGFGLLSALFAYLKSNRKKLKFFHIIRFRG